MGVIPYHYAIRGQCVGHRVLSKKYHMRAKWLYYFLSFTQKRRSVKFSHKKCQVLDRLLLRGKILQLQSILYLFSQLYDLMTVYNLYRNYLIYCFFVPFTQILNQKLKLSVHFIIYILLIITFHNSFFHFLIK